MGRWKMASPGEMTASLFKDAAARAHDFLLEPAAAKRVSRPCSYPRTEIVVLGLSSRCGVTTLARGLALSLQIPGERLSQLLTIGDDAESGLERAFLARSPSVLVWDVASGDAAPARGVAHRADAVVLVAGTDSEPALADLAARMLTEDLGRVVLVANRVTDASRWSGRADFCIPESRLGAALLGRGWRLPGAFGAALGRLADLVEAP